MSGFISESIKTKQPLIDDNFTHAVCIGQTGCGKTSSFILPNVKKRLHDGHGMFVIDFKGSLNQQIKALALKEDRIKDVIEIGVAWGDNINLLSNVSKELFLESIEKLDGDAEKDKFWTTSALAILGIIYDILKYIGYIQSLESNRSYLKSFQKNYTLNIQTFVKITQNQKALSLFLEKIANKTSILYNRCREGEIDSKSRDQKLTLKFMDKMAYLMDKLRIFTEDIDEDRPSSGSSGVLFMIKNYLNSYDQSGLDGSLDVVKMLESKKIVIVRANSFSKYAMEGFMHILYTRLAKKDTKTPVSLVIDEFQRTVTKNSIPFVDIFREKKVELIAAFQNTSQLNIKLGEEEAEEFLLNMVTRFDYAQKDEFELKTFEYMVNNKKYISQPIFFEESDLEDVQYIWQAKTRKAIKKSGKWIYKKSYDSEKCTIFDIETKSSKVHYLLNEDEDKMVAF